jgi:DNA-binding transcriptional ArsR family regulator
MSTYDISPQPDLVIRSEEQIRAYVHPTRMVILDLLAKEKMTVTGIARQLDTHPANITHHIKQLEKASLIVLVEKRETGKNLEKYYRAVAFHFTVSSGEVEGSNKGVLALSILRDNLNTAIRNLKTGSSKEGEPPFVYGLLHAIHLSQTDLEAFATKLGALIDEFDQASSPEGQLFNLNISLYPGETTASPGREVFIRENE